MAGILGLTLVMMIVIAILALTMNQYAAFWYKTLVADPFETINMIMDSEEVPGRWRIRFLEALAQDQSSFWGRASRGLLAKWYLFRLDQVVVSIRHSSLIKPADKKDYLAAFADIRADWKSSPDVFWPTDPL